LLSLRFQVPQLLKVKGFDQWHDEGLKFPLDRIIHRFELLVLVIERVDLDAQLLCQLLKLSTDILQIVE
jgi:hypothetical protein